MEKRILILFSLFLVIINAELNNLQIAPFQCRSIQASPNRCNFQDLSSKFYVDEFSKFLQLDFQNAEIFKSIIQNSNISKGEIKINLIKFAFTLPENFKQIFITVLENFINISKRIEIEFDKIVENGSMEAKFVYNQIKNIYKNDNLTSLEECKQINTIINASLSTFITELENLFGPLTNNCISNLSLSVNQNAIIPFTSEESPSIGNNPPYDFQKGLIIPENQTPNNFDLNQIFGGLDNNNNNVGKNPLNNNGQDLIGTFNEVILLVKNLNNLINGLQNLYNLNGLLKFPNGFNLGSILPPVSNNNLNLPNQNMFSNFNLNNLLTPNNNNNNVAMNYPNYYNSAAVMDKSNLMYGNQNSPNYRNPFYPNYPYQS